MSELTEALEHFRKSKKRRDTLAAAKEVFLKKTTIIPYDALREERTPEFLEANDLFQQSENNGKVSTWRRVFEELSLVFINGKVATTFPVLDPEKVVKYTRGNTTKYKTKYNDSYAKDAESFSKILNRYIEDPDDMEAWSNLPFVITRNVNTLRKWVTLCRESDKKLLKAQAAFDKARSTAIDIYRRWETCSPRELSKLNDFDKETINEITCL